MTLTLLPFICIAIVIIIFKKKIMESLKNLKQFLQDAFLALKKVEEEVEKIETEEQEVPVNDSVIKLDYKVAVPESTMLDGNALYHATKGFQDLTSKPILSRNGTYSPSLEELVNSYEGQKTLTAVYTNKTDDFDATVNIEITVGEDNTVPEEDGELKQKSTKEITGLKFGDADIEDTTNTVLLREEFKEDNTIYKLPENERIYSLGVLPTDRPHLMTFSGIEYKIRTGSHGIIRIDQRKNVLIDGNNSTLYNLEPAVWNGDLDGDGKKDVNYPATYNTSSQRRFVEILNSKYIGVKNLNVESSNIQLGVTGVRPDYVVYWEFEHGIRIDGSQFVYVHNFKATGVWGDGVYIRNSNDVYVKNVTVNWNGRQGGAIVSGNRVYVDNIKILNSRRAGFDIEGNDASEVAENFVITNSYFDTHLIGLPLGGMGFVKNVLSINNEYYGTPIWCKGNGVDRIRENIMFVGNKAKEFGTYEHTDNILIDGLEQGGFTHNRIEMGDFENCKNITIRNNDMPSYGREGRSREPFYIVTAYNTPIEEFTIYGNKQKIGVANKNKPVRADKVEVGKWYYIKNLGYSELTKIDSTKVRFSNIVKPERQATKLDFQYAREFDNMEEALAFSLKEGVWYKIGDTIYSFKGGTDFIEITLEHLPILYPIDFIDDYVPTDEEANKIPFETSEYITTQWDRLYKKSWKDEDYVDDGWEPEWLKEIN